MFKKKDYLGMAIYDSCFKQVHKCKDYAKSMQKQ